MSCKRFDAISVREDHGVTICNDIYHVKAEQVIDPVFLLDHNNYCELAQRSRRKEDTPYLLAYILDMTPEKKNIVEQYERNKGLQAKFVSAEKDASLSVEEWLAQFRDASYVITDSYHGTVFSIIFNKEFKCLYNESRGSTRFDTLFALLNNNLITDKKEDSISFLESYLN